MDLGYSLLELTEDHFRVRVFAKHEVVDVGKNPVNYRHRGLEEFLVGLHFVVTFLEEKIRGGWT